MNQSYVILYAPIGNSKYETIISNEEYILLLLSGNRIIVFYNIYNIVICKTIIFWYTTSIWSLASQEILGWQLWLFIFYLNTLVGGDK